MSQEAFFYLLELEDGSSSFNAGAAITDSPTNPIKIRRRLAAESGAITPSRLFVYRNHKPRKLPGYLRPKKLANTDSSQFNIDPWDAQNQQAVLEAEKTLQNDLQALYERLQAMREVERKEMEKRGLVDAENTKKRLEDAITFRGSCKDLCPTFERVRRAYENNVKEFEKDPNTGKVSREYAVKAFSRPAAGQPPPLPSDVRPPDTLLKALDHLMKNIISQLPASHSFLWDRTRSIRQDFTYQNYSGPEAVYCNELIVRIHILTLHIMAESNIEYSQQQELEQMNKALQTLTEFYHSSNSIVSDMEAEMRAYLLLSHLRDPDIEHGVQRQMPFRLWQNPYIITSTWLRSLAQQNNLTDRGHINTENAPNLFTEFFSMMKNVAEVPFLQMCLLETHFSSIRLNALRAMARSYHPRGKPYSLSRLAKMLGFDSSNQAAEFCEHYSMSVFDDKDTHEQCVDLGTLSTQKLNEAAPLPPTYTLWVEDRRRGRSNYDIVHADSHLNVLRHAPTQDNTLSSSISAARKQTEEQNLRRQAALSVTDQILRDTIEQSIAPMISDAITKVQKRRLQEARARQLAEEERRKQQEEKRLLAERERLRLEEEERIKESIRQQEELKKQRIAEEKRRQERQARIDFLGSTIWTDLCTNFYYDALREAYADGLYRRGLVRKTAASLRRALMVLKDKRTKLKQVQELEKSLQSDWWSKVRVKRQHSGSFPKPGKDIIVRPSKLPAPAHDFSLSFSELARKRQQFWEPIDMARMLSILKTSAGLHNAHVGIAVCSPDSSSPASKWMDIRLGLDKSPLRTIADPDTPDTSLNIFKLESDPDSFKHIGLVIYVMPETFGFEQSVQELFLLADTVVSSCYYKFDLFIVSWGANEEVVHEAVKALTTKYCPHTICRIATLIFPKVPDVLEDKLQDILFNWANGFRQIDSALYIRLKREEQESALREARLQQELRLKEQREAALRREHELKAKFASTGFYRSYVEQQQQRELDSNRAARVSEPESSRGATVEDMSSGALNSSEVRLRNALVRAQQLLRE